MFQMEQPEISLKRVLTAMKDEYFLNDKLSQRNEIMSVFESGGFSYSNPYYIVRQGKVCFHKTLLPINANINGLFDV